jgi:hypothetical protein
LSAQIFNKKQELFDIAGMYFLTCSLMARVSRLHREGVGSIPTESTVAVAYWFADKNVALIDTGSIPVSHPILVSSFEL